jgi:ABC-type bacteriocin/lantibiotic exporter with double-glycine peptidase domain
MLRATVAGAPDVLILDEATSALDVETERDVLANVRDFMRGRGLIVISHREHVAGSLDRTLWVEDGRAASAGG